MLVLTDRCPAKINLTLRVGAARDDGYHELESVVAWLNFADQIRITQRDDTAVLLHCDDPRVPTDDGNLVMRVVRRLQPRRLSDFGIDIHLDKRIPPGTGLGGGSSNAATALRMLNLLWQTRLGRDEQLDLAASLGSDIPLFLHGPLTVIRGRGEDVEEFDADWDVWVVLVLPQLHCETRAVYAAFDELPPPPPRPLVPAITAARNARGLMPLLFNDLEEAALRVVPALADVTDRARSALGRDTRLTGSGSGLFHLYDDRSEAEQRAVLARERCLGCDVITTRLALDDE